MGEQTWALNFIPISMNSPENWINRALKYFKLENKLVLLNSCGQKQGYKNKNWKASPWMWCRRTTLQTWRCLGVACRPLISGTNCIVSCSPAGEAVCISPVLAHCMLLEHSSHWIIWLTPHDSYSPLTQGAEQKRWGEKGGCSAWWVFSLFCKDSEV